MCTSPIQAWQTVSGDVLFHESARHDISRSLTLPCGQCGECRLERSRQWATRCMHEAQMHDENCFLTLTYADEHLPHDWSLDHRDFQNFVKRLRKSLGKKKIKFYMCGEYGEKFDRPHFHCVLFGHDFADKYPWRKSPAGCLQYRSDELEKLWTFGNVEIGDVTFESAAYVARYVMKKVNGPLAEHSGHYQFCDLQTGELLSKRPEYNQMSKGLAKSWYEKYKDDVRNGDYVVVRGHQCKVPRYYDKLLQAEDPEEFELVKARRAQRARDRFDPEEQTPDRDAVRAKVLNAKLRYLKRELQ